MSSCVFYIQGFSFTVLLLDSNDFYFFWHFNGVWSTKISGYSYIAIGDAKQQKPEE